MPDWQQPASPTVPKPAAPGNRPAALHDLARPAADSWVAGKCAEAVCTAARRIPRCTQGVNGSQRGGRTRMETRRRRRRLATGVNRVAGPAWAGRAAVSTRLARNVHFVQNRHTRSTHKIDASPVAACEVERFASLVPPGTGPCPAPCHGAAACPPALIRGALGQ